MAVRALAEILLERLRADDLQGFEDRLTDPLVSQAFECSDGLVFHKACDHINMGFVRAALPHTLPRYIGKEVNYSVVCRNRNLFEMLITCNASVFDHIHPKTLYLLAQRSLDVQNMPYSQHNIEQDMLVLFLDNAPKEVTDQQLQQMYTSHASKEALSMVEDLLAQQQKQILEQHIPGVIPVNTGRKM